MANSKLFACVVLLFFILQHHEVLYVEGRHLGLPRESSKPKENAMNVAARGGVQHEKTKQEEDEVDNFRPTTPGHSPGVGHSINH